MTQAWLTGRWTRTSRRRPRWCFGPSWRRSNRPARVNCSDMKQEIEVQRAHDVLVALILGEVPSPVATPAAKDDLILAASVLCWVLEHDHNPKFTQYLKLLEDKLRAMGYALSGPVHPN